MIAALATPAEHNVVVMGDGNDDWLVDAREVVQGEQTAHDVAGIYSALVALLKQTPAPDAVELISHSQEDNYLLLGQAVLDASAMQNAPADLVDKLSGKKLRIVGCYTAIGKLANTALAAMAQALNMEVWGTTGLIGSPNLYAGGLKPSQRSKLLRQPSTGPASSVSTVSEEDLAFGGPAVPFAAEQRRRLFDGVNSFGRQQLDNLLLPSLDHYYVYPGILRVPDSQSPLYAADSSSRIVGHVDLLFRDQVLRVTRRDWGPAPVEWVFLLPRPTQPLQVVRPVAR